MKKLNMNNQLVKENLEKLVKQYNELLTSYDFSSGELATFEDKAETMELFEYFKKTISKLEEQTQKSFNEIIKNKLNINYFNKISFSQLLEIENFLAELFIQETNKKIAENPEKEIEEMKKNIKGENTMKNLKTKFTNQKDYIEYLKSIAGELPTKYQQEINLELAFENIDNFETTEIKVPNYSLQDLKLEAVQPKNLLKEIIELEKNIDYLAKEKSELLEKNRIQELKIEALEQDKKDLKHDRDYFKDLVENLRATNIELANNLVKATPEPKKPVKKIVSKKDKVPTEKDDLLLSKKINFKFEIPEKAVFIGEVPTNEIFKALTYTTNKQGIECKYIFVDDEILASDSYRAIRIKLKHYSKELIALDSELLKKIKTDCLKYSDSIELYANEKFIFIKYNNRVLMQQKREELKKFNLNELFSRCETYDLKVELDKKDLELQTINKEKNIDIFDKRYNLNFIKEAVKITNKATLKIGNFPIYFNNENTEIIIMNIAN